MELCKVPLSPFGLPPPLEIATFCVFPHLSKNLPKMKTTPPPRPSSPPPQNDEDRRGLTPSERLRILSLLRNASDRRGLTPPKSLPPPPSSWKQTEDHSDRLAIKIEERLSDLVWDLMDDEGKAPRFSESYYIQRERFQKVLLDVVCTSDQYDKAIKTSKPCLHEIGFGSFATLLDTSFRPSDRSR